MWRLKIAEGDGPWLRTTNNYVGRQVWEFDPNSGTADEIAAVEQAREAFRLHRFQMKQNADLIMRMQFAKENPVDLELLPMVKLAEHEEVSEEVVLTLGLNI